MFGYVIPRKSELRVKDLDLYNVIYCSLCRVLQKNYGIAAKALLNYDFVFLSLLGLSLEEEDYVFLDKRCTTNPLKKQRYIESDVLEFAAACLVISSYYKLSDNIVDEGFFKKSISIVGRFFISLPFKRALKRHGDVADLVEKSVTLQQKLEKAEVSSIDRAADPSATALSYMFSHFGTSEEEKRILLRVGYLFGRFIYLADCCDDLVEDIKKERYNPIKIKNILIASDDSRIPEILSDTKEELFLTRSELVKSYNLIKFKNNRDILDNIVFLGLSDTISSLGTKKKKQSIALKEE